MSKEGYIENKDKESERNKKYYEENKEKISEKQKRYYEKNKEKILERNKRYKERNKDKLVEIGKRYNERHKEKIRKKSKRYREEHKEDIKEYKRKNRDKILQQCKNKYRENKEELAKASKEYNDISKRKANNHRKAWTYEEDKILLECRDKNVRFIEIAELLGRSFKATMSRYKVLTKWTEKEKAELLRLAGSGLKRDDISKELKKSCISVSMEYKFLTGEYISI